MSVYDRIVSGLEHAQRKITESIPIDGYGMSSPSSRIEGKLIVKGDQVMIVAKWMSLSNIAAVIIASAAVVSASVPTSGSLDVQGGSCKCTNTDKGACPAIAGQTCTAKRMSCEYSGSGGTKPNCISAGGDACSSSYCSAAPNQYCGN